MNDKAVYRTAPATPGLLINVALKELNELSCTEGKVSVNFLHDLGDIKQHLHPTSPVKKTAYNEVLKKNLKSP